MGENELFLQALNAALKNEKVTWADGIPPETWYLLFQLAEKHHILPMIYEAVYNCPAAKEVDQNLFLPFKQRTVQTVMLQTMKTSEFLALYRTLTDAGVTPVVVKGIICRNLYPNPDYRISGDEDILIPEGCFSKCHELMIDCGMECAESEIDIEQAYEVPYGKKGSPIYIEAHKALFPPDSEAYGDFNRFFTDIWRRAIKVSVDGVQILTMGYTDHLFYLICHSFKHFLHSGFGIRQVCDIILFANQYGREVDWQLLLKQCQEIRADLFTAALFKIGQKYLTFDPVKACYPPEWQKVEVDETLLLNDLLDAGVYGDGSMSRKHSSNMTINAVESQKQGKKAGRGFLKSLFPSAKALEKRYPYLQKKPFLLPVAWVSRIWTYKKETDRGNNNNAAESIKIGEQRVELMKQYGILDADK
ncbi:MAG: nucleotidyltransferase family protein [Lachnospiraceae bacterium]|nr:nucleotidyltransferase family protein [Lachnospiraceae bacterium]